MRIPKPTTILTPLTQMATNLLTHPLLLYLRYSSDRILGSLTKVPNPFSSHRLMCADITNLLFCGDCSALAHQPPCHGCSLPWSSLAGLRESEALSENSPRDPFPVALGPTRYYSTPAHLAGASQLKHLTKHLMANLVT